MFKWHENNTSFVLQGGVSIETCDPGLESRVLIAGDYDRHQCGITIPGIQLQDTGLWQCEGRTYLIIMMMMMRMRILMILFRWRSTNSQT